MNIYIIVAIILVIYCVLAWFVGNLLQLYGTSLWLLRGGLALIGIAAASIFLWFHHKLKRSRERIAGQNLSESDDITVLLQRANEKLRDSGKSGRLASFPIIFILGEPNSAKTSSILHSGMDPELLAGHVFRDSDLVPTTSINIWLAMGTVFIEAGGKVTADSSLWEQLLRRTRPARLTAALGKGQQAARAALVCFEFERLVSAQNSVKVLGARLKEMARSLGAPFPVFVLFTKLDRMPQFADFVGTFTSDESAQVLGATLKRTASTSTGVFAEEESKRLTYAFDQLLYSLAEKRLDYLARESAGNKLPGIYEFPRELKKTRNHVIKFLIDVSRPTQLGTNPFLRGFYFSGVRAITVNESMPLAAASRTAAVSASAATRMFGQADSIPSPEPKTGTRAVQSRKIPEWSFLPHLFTNVILRDPEIFSSGKQSTRVQQLRRVLLGSVAVLFLFYAVALLVSYFNNRDLRLAIQNSATALAAASPGQSDVASREQLNSLDQLRLYVAQLQQYKREGPPASYSFGLYSGNRLYPEARRIYFGYFRRLLLAPTQTTIIASLRKLPDSPSPADEYSEPYNSLKAYLITTLRRDQSTRNFLAPVLLDRWTKARGVEPERARIASAQFQFYSDELPRENVVPVDADMGAIEHARHYLIQFNESEKVYQKMLTEAGKNNPSINFNRDFPGSSATIVNSHEVPGAFTRGGYRVVQEALRDPSRFFGGEEWVLGDRTTVSVSGDQIMQRLRERYTSDYVSQWQGFLKATTFVRYSGLQDASAKLKTLSENRSPLLQLFWVAAQNMAVDNASITNQFQPVQLVGSGTAEQLIAGANQPYMGALVALGSNVAGLAAEYPNGTMDPAATAPVLQAATAARSSVRQIAQGFHVDGAAHIDDQVHNLMEAPIISAEALMRAMGPGQLNAAGKNLCSQFDALARKYPFNPNNIDHEASLDDLKFFQPGSGALWTFYDASLKSILVRQGEHFVANPSATIHVSGQFIAFMDRAAILSDALYPAGGPTGPHLLYTVHQPRVKGINHLDLSIDGSHLEGAGDKSGKFTWPGTASRGLRLEVSSSHTNPQPPEFPGLWGVFRFFNAAARWTPNSSGTEFEWPLESKTQFVGRQVGGKEAEFVIRYEVEGAAGQLFRKEFFQQMRCSALGAH
ncbi:MAG TPA: ImcF-related family protein [Candidatus Angelobacter sp.]|jgi:type VI secretion system protein ImpL